MAIIAHENLFDLIEFKPIRLNLCWLLCDPAPMLKAWRF
jgi:hypothetical protein